MRAIVQARTREVEVQQRDQPTLDADQVLVEMHSAGLCGSDAHAYTYEDSYKQLPISRVMGHEYAGTVVEEPIHSCGTCFQCKNGQANICQNFAITGMHRDGAYAKYVAVAELFVHRIPDSVPLKHAAVMEPTSIAMHTVFTQTSVMPGDNVLVSGLEVDTGYHLPLLEDVGVDTVNVEATDLVDCREEFTDSVGFDAVFDTISHHTGVDHVRKGGEEVVIGLPGAPNEVFVTPVVRNEITVQMSYGSHWRNFEQAIRLIENGAIDVDAIVDRSYDVDDPTAAVEWFLDSETYKPVFTFA